ncbi:MAG: hypothetical protein NTX11_00665 [Candidatus Saccharibacteria bacterium]|nr:hypothetical protein [Candidatus Saccharibacteria bacterium]
MTKRNKNKKTVWFKQVRGSYIPVAWQGWLTYIPYIYFLGASALAVDRSSHSVSDTIIGIVPYWVSALVIMSWIAKRKS